MGEPGHPAVVTGAGSVTGAAAARLLARDGWRVVVVGRDPGRTRAVAAEAGGEATVADVARLDDVRAPGVPRARGRRARQPAGVRRRLAVALWEASADRVGLTGADRC